MARTAKTVDPERLPFGKLLGWAGAGVSAGGNYIILGFLALYAADTLGINPAIVGTVILVANVANAVFGIIAAWIVDRSPETRWGKARPYEFAVIGIWLATWALFSTPVSLDQTGRIIWLFVMFIGIQAIFDTLLRANDLLYVARAFAHRRVVAKVQTRSAIFTTLGGMAISISLPIVLSSVGKSPEGWSLVIGIYAVVLGAIGMSRFLVVKEVYTTSDTGAAPVRLRDILTAIVSNKWVYALGAVTLIQNIITGSNNMAQFYFRYVVGDLSMLGVVGAFGVLVLPVVLIFPRLMKKFSVSTLLIAGAIAGIIGSTIFGFAGTSLPVIVIALIFNGLAVLPASYLFTVLLLDVADYNEWRGRRRMESTLSSIVGIFGKLGLGLAGFITGQVLAAAGYDGTKDVQSASANAAIVGLVSWFPGVLFTLLIVLMLIYGRFDRRLLPKVHAELVDIRAARAAAVAAGEADPVTTSTTVPKW